MMKCENSYLINSEMDTLGYDSWHIYERHLQQVVINVEDIILRSCTRCFVKECYDIRRYREHSLRI